MTKYIITDPCYILDSDTWQDCCSKANRNGLWDDEFFDLLVMQALEQKSGSKAWATGTGIGDWDNSIGGNYKKVIQNRFVADSGMVCVCKWTEEIEQYLKEEYGRFFEMGIAIIECVGDIDVELDKSDSSWTVVKIKDDEGRFESLLADCFDEEEDYEEDE